METVQPSETDQRYELKSNDFFIRKTLWKFMVTSVISMVFLYFGSLVDTLLVGAYLHEDGLSAMSLVSPVYLVFYTVGATIGIGASIVASRAFGQGQVNEYRSLFTCATLSMGVAVLVMMGLFYACFDPVMRLLCGTVSGAQVAMARSYLLCYIPGGGLTLMSYIPLYFLKIDGRPKVSSRLFLLSAIINVILSWLFISPVCNLGAGGVGLATSISMGTVAVLGFIIMLRGKTELRFVRKSFSWARLRTMTVAGIPNGLSNLLESARILLINLLLIYTGVSMLLPCYTVVRNVTDVLNSVIVGMTSAVLPLFGVFFGERDYHSERDVFHRAWRVGIPVIAVLSVIVCVIPDALFRLFGVSDAALMQEGRWALPLACIGLVAAYVNSLYIGYLTSIKREGLATVLVALRLLVLLSVFAFPLALTVGSKGIWASLSLAEVATLIVFFGIRAAVRRRSPELDRYLLNTEQERDGDISFSVRNRNEDIVAASEGISLFCEDHGIDMKRSMRVSLAIEEILTFLTSHCLDTGEENHVSLRVCKIGEEVMVRFRYVGEMYDPMAVYEDNAENAERQEELLGLKLVVKSATLVNYRQVLGANNLMIMF